MGGFLTEKDLEEAAEKALQNFGTPGQILMSTGNAVAWTNMFYPIAPTYTLEKVINYFTGMRVEDMGQDYIILREAAAAFHNIGFDPRPDKS